MRENPSVPALYAFLLGSIVAGSLLIAFLQRNSAPNMPPFATHLGSLALFHFLEYYWQVKYHPNTTTSEGKAKIVMRKWFLLFLAFLLNHSKEYLLAIIMGVIEYSLRRLLRLSPVWLWAQLLGTFLITIGIIVRSMAMITAATSFSHDIKNKLGKGHKLVREGIYSLCRHPSYLGFFAFAVGGQIILGNLISTIIFVFVLQKFFRERVAVEEAILLKQYPQEYAEYKLKTWSGIPFHSD